LEPYEYFNRVLKMTEEAMMPKTKSATYYPRCPRCGKRIKPMTQEEYEQSTGLCLKCELAQQANGKRKERASL